MTPELHALSLIDASERLRNGSLAATAYVDALLARVATTDVAIEAWAHIDPARAHSAADRIDCVRPGERGLLHGIAIGVKDIIATTAMPTEMGTPVFAGHHPAFDAAVIARLSTAGGHVLGKTVTTEFAFMHPGKTRNPWNPRHTPGGSSSGSAAAVAAGQVPGALGTQTNGSMIRPAAFCGVVGFKPTRGALPFEGVNVFSATLDTLGTFTRSVPDAAMLAGALAEPGTIAATVRPADRPPRLAYLANFPWTQVCRDAGEMLDAAAIRLRHAGADVVPVVLPEALVEAVDVLRTIMLHEAARNLGELQARERTRLSAELNAALDEGAAMGVDAYARALAGRGAMVAAATEWMSHYDAVITPPAPGPAPEGIATTGDPSCCTLWSLLGFPAITIPIGFAANRLPLGVQLAAPANADDALLSAATWCETRMPFTGLA